MVEIESGFASGSNVDITFGSDTDGQPLVTDPVIATRDNELFF